jgi:hypothetical protein
VAAIETQGISLEGIEDVFRICGRQTGMAALDQRISEYVKAHDPRILSFLKDMEKYDKPHLQGSPGSDHNLQRKDRPDLNYFAPKKILQDLLAMDWFDEASADKKKYTVKWRNQLIEDLMASDCRDEVAEAWANKDLRLQVKGHVMGALTKAGIFLKNKYTPIARIYYGTLEDSKDSDTLAKYMGEYKKTFYGDWIVEYVTKSNNVSQTSTIEK